MTSTATQDEHTLTAIDYVFDFDELLCAPVPSTSQPPIHTSDLPSGGTLTFRRTAVEKPAINTMQLQWTASSDCSQLVSHSFSFAELFYLSSDDKPTFVDAVWGQYHPSWPHAESHSLALAVTRAAIALAEAKSSGKFNFQSHTRYRARLSFLQHVTDSVSAPPVTRLELNGLSSAASRVRAQELWATSHLLRSSLPFFAQILASSDFRESSKRTITEHAALSQSSPPAEPRCASEELDEDDRATDKYAGRFAANDAIPPALRHYHVRITSGSYTTYCALLTDLAQGLISFRPLNQPATEAYLDECRSTSPDQPLPVSHKSMYRVAHFQGLPALAKLTLDSYLRQLNAGNVAAELFAPNWTATYDQVRHAVFNVALQHKAAVRNSSEFRRVLEQLRAGELEPGTSAVVAELLPRLFSE
ncbi:hypothetical protein JCM10207_009275 [Rhodosporidiobolus poonsookiae]